MSSSIWTRCAGDSELRALRLTPWRVIEAQHQLSTRKLVDSDEEQRVLEELLDARAKLGRNSRRLIDVSGEDLLILIHVRDPLTVGQQKGLSGLGKHPKGRITT